MKYLKSLLLLVFILGSLTAADAVKTNENFFLYVGNQSYDVNPVDIIIFIDGELVIDQEFDVGNRDNGQEFSFHLPTGVHKLFVKSQKNKVSLEETFTISGRHWATVDFWYNPPSDDKPMPKQFTFAIKDESNNNE